MWYNQLISNEKRYLERARISERKFREVLKLFGADLPALTTAELSGLNYRTVHRIYSLLRDRVVELALSEMKPFAGTSRLMRAISALEG